MARFLLLVLVPLLFVALLVTQIWYAVGQVIPS